MKFKLPQLPANKTERNTKMKTINNKRLLFILIAVICLVTVCAFAEGGTNDKTSVDIICDMLNYELFTDEVHFAITKDLTLDSSLILKKLGLSGAEISWESNSPGVISSTGKVFREKYRDKDVVLTAAVSDGTHTAYKTFSFTVLSEQAKIYMSENFAYDNLKDGISITEATQNTNADETPINVKSPAGWSFSSAGEYRMCAVINKDENSNCILNTYRTANDGNAHYVRHVLESKGREKVIWEADVKFARHAPPQIYTIEIYGVGAAGKQKKERVKFADADIRLNTTGDIVQFGTGYWDGDKTVRPLYTNVSLLENEWSRIKIVMDIKSKKWAVYINGEKFIDDIPFFEKNKTGNENAQYFYVNDFQIGAYRLYAPKSNFCFDNISVRSCTENYSENAAAYEIIDSLSLDMLTGDDPDNIEKELDLSLEQFQDIIKQNSFEVNWISSNEDVLRINAGTASPIPGKTDRDVILTVNISSAQKQFNLSVPAAKMYRRVNAAYDALSFECFSEEPAGAVTKSLDFSEANLKECCDLNGISVEFTSDKPDCVSSEGIVSRTNQDTAVTLTVSVSDNSNGYRRKKEIKINVLSSDKEVYYSSNFHYPALLGKDVSNLSSWGNLTGNSFFITTIEKEENNYLLSSVRTKPANNDYNFTKLSINKECKTKFTVQARLKFIDNNNYEQDNSTAVYVFEIVGTYNVNGKKTNAKVAEMRFGYDYSTLNFKFADGSGIDIDFLPELNRWFDLKVDCDVLNHDIDIYIDGIKINDGIIPFYQSGVPDYDETSFNSVNQIRYNFFRTKENLGIKLDDISITGLNKLYHTCQLTENNEVKAIDSIDYFKGDKIDAVVKLSNPVGSVEEPDVFLAVYDKGVLKDIRKNTAPVTVNPGDCKKLYFPDIFWKSDFSDISVKSFVLEKNSLTPKKTNTKAAAGIRQDYSPEVIYAADTGRKITYIDLFGKTAYKTYFSAQSWSADSRKMYFQGQNYDIYEYNSDTQTIRFISKCNVYYGFVTVPSKNLLLYIDESSRIVKMDIDTYQKSIISVLPPQARSSANNLTVTNDGKYLSLRWEEDNNNFGAEASNLKYTRFPVLDTQTGEWLDDTNHYNGFPDEPPYNTFINPVYSNLLFYCHVSSSNNDRLWLLDTVTDKNYNVYKQKPYTKTLSGESVSHETWTYDGERIVMAINKLDLRQIGPNGIVSVNKDGKDRRVINDEYSYLHLGASPVSDRWVVGDTGYNGISTDIILADCYTGKSYKLATVKQNSKDSVAHGHPAFSPDGKQVYFGMYNKDYSSAGIGIIDVSDIVENAAEHKIIQLSDNCRTESSDGFSYSLKEIILGGKTAYKTEAGKQVNINYLGNDTEQASTAITIEYYAEDAQVELEYYRWHKYTDNAPSKLEVKTQPLDIENGGWRTVRVNIDNINLEGYGKLGGDFTLKTTKGNIAIGAVRVELNQPVVSAG